MTKPFKGKIELDVRDSVADWDAFTPKAAPTGAPNVLVVLFDDTASPRGRRSAAGSRCRRCRGSPTTASSTPSGIRRRSAHPRARLPHRPQPPLERLRLDLGELDGLSRLQLAHPARERDDRPHAPRRRLQHFLGREEPQHPGRCLDAGLFEEGMAARDGLRPLLRLHRRRDEQLVSRPGRGQPLHRPALPARGRLPPLEDLGDQALRFIRDSKQSEPDKPWYLWFCPGANHAPHHAPEEYIEKYKGLFDDGYEAYREWVLPRMIEKGILPEGTELTPINPMRPARSRG